MSFSHALELKLMWFFHSQNSKSCLAPLIISISLKECVYPYQKKFEKIMRFFNSKLRFEVVVVVVKRKMTYLAEQR